MKEIVHIGFSKTASSWFQTQFFPEIENVDFIDKFIVKQQIIEPNTFDFNIEKTQSFFINNYNKRLLLSHENLIGSINSSGFNGIATKEFGKRIKSVFPDADIIIFIRNQPDLIASAYLQEITEGSTNSTDSFLFHKNRNFYNNMMMFSFVYLEYHKVIKFYYELFGQNKVHVFLYEDFANDKINFLKAFSSIFNLDVNFEKLSLNKYNYRIRNNLIPFVKVSNYFTKKNTIFKYYVFNVPYWYAISRRIFIRLNKYKIFGKFPSTVSILGKKNYDFINNYYKTSNNILYKEFGINSIEKYNYPL